VRAAGIGRLLVRETARQAYKQGATHLRLSVDRENHKARHFYEKIGLQESADESIFAAYERDFVNLVEAV
jgi:ribosomal protein S18 acetylase RimI-like enzyme